MNNVLKVVGDIKSFLANAIMIFTAVSAGFTFTFNYFIDGQQQRAQYSGNLVAYTQVVKQYSKLRSDPEDVKPEDLRMGLEICNSKDFNEFFLTNVPSYEKVVFERACSIISDTLNSG